MSTDDLTKLLGIRFERDGDNRFIAWSNLPAETAVGTIEPARWMMTAIADACSQHGADKLAGKGRSALMCNSTSRFFSNGQGSRFMAVAEKLYQDNDSSSWRTSLYRLGDNERQTPDKLVADFSADFIDIEQQETPVIISEQPKLLSVAELTPFAESQTETIADRRRQQIFIGACEVIARKGFGAASMREIAKAANITIPTMYKYIETKEDILFMITQVCMEEIFNNFQHSLTTSDDAQTKMTCAIDTYVRYVSKNRKYINLVYRETRSLNSENRNRIFNIEREFMELWEQIIRQGIEEKVFREQDTYLSANMIYFFCNVWALRQWTLDGYTEQQIKDRLVSFILPGLT